MITPKRKPPNLPLHPDDKAYNKTVNQVRYKIERVIANIKTWRVLHTGYRRPLETFPETITTILGLIFTYTPRISLLVSRDYTIPQCATPELTASFTRRDAGSEPH